MPRGKSSPQQKAAATRRNNKLKKQKEEAENIIHLKPEKPEPELSVDYFADNFLVGMNDYSPEQQNEIFAIVATALRNNFAANRDRGYKESERHQDNLCRFNATLDNALNAGANKNSLYTKPVTG